MKPHDVISPQSFAPESPRDSIECAEHKTSDGERREPRALLDRASLDGQTCRASRRRLPAAKVGKSRHFYIDKRPYFSYKRIISLT